MSLERGTDLEVKPVDNAPSVVVGTVTTGAPGSQVSVTNVGSAQNAVFNFEIPQGPQGAQGLQGPQGTPGTDGINGTNGANGVSPNLTIGAVNTLASGSAATATITGAFPNLQLNLGIPMGPAGSGSSVAWGGVTGVLANQTDLNNALNGKAAAAHTHAEGDVTGLTAALAEMASLSAANVFTYAGASPTLDITNPDNGTTGALRVRANATTGDAIIQFTNTDASLELANIAASGTGVMLNGHWFVETPAAGDDDNSIATTAFVHGALAAIGPYAPIDSPPFTGSPTISGALVGFRNLPTSRTLNANATLADADKGKKIVWTGGVGTITINDNATTAIDADAIGTIVNNGTGNLTLARGANVSAKLMGSGADANRIIPPGCVATWFKVAANTYFVGGAGVQ